MSHPSDLALSLREQPRAVGARRERMISWEVPPAWRTEVLELPEGSMVPLAVVITSLDEGVLVEVSGEVELVGQCVRCLDRAVVPVVIAGAEVYTEAPQSEHARGRRVDSRDPDIEIEGDEFDPEFLIDRDTVDLEPLLRDEIFADAPLQPVCAPDCLGMCEHCGILLKDAPQDHHHEFLDSRFAALKTLLEDSNG